MGSEMCIRDRGVGIQHRQIAGHNSGDSVGTTFAVIDPPAVALAMVLRSFARDWRTVALAEAAAAITLPVPKRNAVTLACLESRIVIAGRAVVTYPAATARLLLNSGVRQYETFQPVSSLPPVLFSKLSTTH